jgi:hypothetical protein
MSDHDDDLMAEFEDSVARPYRAVRDDLAGMSREGRSAADADFQDAMERVRVLIPLAREIQGRMRALLPSLSDVSEAHIRASNRFLEVADEVRAFLETAERAGRIIDPGVN